MRDCLGRYQHSFLTTLFPKRVYTWYFPSFSYIFEVDIIGIPWAEMADPLSITTSIIAVIGAAETVGKTLNRIRDMTNAPDEILALSNEISDLTVVLKHVETYATAADRAVTSPEHLEHISVLAKRAQSRLSQLEQIMHKHLSEPAAASWRSSLSRFRWACLKTKINGLRVDLRDIKLSIIVQISTVTGCVIETQLLYSSLLLRFL